MSDDGWDDWENPPFDPVPIPHVEVTEVENPVVCTLYDAAGVPLLDVLERPSFPFGFRSRRP